MIKINISKDKIILEGHALYDDIGKDIVCSALSSIVTTTINGILTFNKNYIKYIQEKDKLTIEIVEHNEVVDNLMKNMINMIDVLKSDYPKNLKIRKEN